MSMGIKKGDRLALLSEGRNDWVISELGILYAGAIDVPLANNFRKNIEKGVYEKGILVKGLFKQAMEICKKAVAIRALEDLLSMEPDPLMIPETKKDKAEGQKLLQKYKK